MRFAGLDVFVGSRGLDLLSGGGGFCCLVIFLFVWGFFWLAIVINFAQY